MTDENPPRASYSKRAEKICQKLTFCYQRNLLSGTPGGCKKSSRTSLCQEVLRVIEWEVISKDDPQNSIDFKSCVRE